MTPKSVKRLLVVRKLYNFFKVMSIILFFARVLTNILFYDKIIFVIEGRSSLSPSVRECAVGASASEEYAKVALLDSGRTAVCLLEPDGEHRYMRKRGGYYPQNQVVPRFFRPEQIKILLRAFFSLFNRKDDYRNERTCKKLQSCRI